MDIKEQLRRDEGVKKFAYKDTVGKTTIGVGRNLDDKGLSEDEIDLLLIHDINEVFIRLRKAYSWFITLDEARQGVLLNMAFNMGSLEKFPRFLALVEAGDYDAAATEMLDSLWARQVGLRSERLSFQMRTGVWQ